MKNALIALMLCFFGALSAQTTLTFTGKDNLDNYVQLHHVVVENLTQGWADTLYYPDTVLIMSGVGLTDHETATAFAVSQNVPDRPFRAEGDRRDTTARRGDALLPGVAEQAAVVPADREDRP